MDIIMLKDVHKIGHKYEIINVANGYANYLIQLGYAEIANEPNRKKLVETIKQTQHKEQEIKKKEKAIAEKIQAFTLVIPVKADENGKIFGSVTTSQIALALQKEGFDIESRQIKHTNAYKEIGTYQISIQLYKEIEAILNFEIKSLN